MCLPVYYERLVLDPKNQMKRILGFLGVKWDDIVVHHEKAIGKKGGISLSKYVKACWKCLENYEILLHLVYSQSCY